MSFICKMIGSQRQQDNVSVGSPKVDRVESVTLRATYENLLWGIQCSDKFFMNQPLHRSRQSDFSLRRLQ